MEQVALWIACWVLSFGGCVDPPPIAPTHVHGNTTVLDARTGLMVQAPSGQFVVDRFEPVEGTSDQAGRVSFLLPGQAFGRGGWIVVSAAGYGETRVRAVVTALVGELDVHPDYEHPPRRDVVYLEPLPPVRVIRTGRVRVVGRTFVDDQGPFLGFGVSFFTAPWACEFDHARYRANLEYLADRGVNYQRFFGVVGFHGHVPTGDDTWGDRTIDPRRAEWAASIACAIDTAYEYGIRSQITLFAGTETVPNRSDREDVALRLLDVIAPRAEKVLFIEVANEGWQNGIDEIEEQRVLARILDLSGHLIALTSPGPGDWREQIEHMYAGFPRPLVTLHFDRSTSGTGGVWRPVRQVYEGWQAASGKPWINNEPIGPGSSVNDERDPLRLVMSAALTWMTGGAGYTLHSGPGIRFCGQWDTLRGLPCDFWDVPHIEQTLAGVQSVMQLLAPDTPNWRLWNGTRAAGQGHPFDPGSIQDAADRGDLLRAFATVSGDGRFVVGPIQVTSPVPFMARRAMTVQLLDPLTGTVLEERALAPGETWFVSPRRAEDAFLIRGQQ